MNQVYLNIFLTCFAITGVYTENVNNEAAAPSQIEKLLLLKSINQASKILPPQDACGIQAIKPRLNQSPSTSRIIKGNKAVPNSWPWLVSIRIETDHFGLKHVCGGALIYRDIVLTAAHCLVDLFNMEGIMPINKNKIFVIVGSNYLDSTTIKKANIFPVKNFTYNSEFFTSRIFSDDIAIIKLARPVILSKRVALICLPFSFENANKPINKTVWAAGWGSLTIYPTPFSNPNALQQTCLRVLDNDTVCNFTLPQEEIHDEKLKMNQYDRMSQYCVKHDSGMSGSCHGDSGGPLMYFDDDFKKWFIYGVTSLGKRFKKKDSKCDTTLPGYYTRVPYYLSWLANNLSL
jgi:secreted trypsin-like serine protease